MSDAWGADDYDDDFDDGNPFGSGGGGTGGDSRAQAQQQDTRSTDDYLREAIGNLVETEEMGEEGLAHLAAQREVLDNIKNNVNRMDNTLDVADRKITEMENPWAIGPVATKSSGNRYSKTGDVGAAGYSAEGGGQGFMMEGEVMKRGRMFKAWNKRYFRQKGGCIEYFNSKTDSKLRGQFVLKGAVLNRVSYGQRDSNGAECNKDNCFEIIQAGESKGDTIHVESTSDFNTWLSAIERMIKPERHKSQAAYASGDVPRAAGATGNAAGGRRGVGFGNAQQDAMVDQIIDHLDNIDGISRMMGAEVDDQTRIIKDLTDDMDRLDSRVDQNKNRVQRIK